MGDEFILLEEVVENIGVMGLIVVVRRYSLWWGFDFMRC